MLTNLSLCFPQTDAQETCIILRLAMFYFNCTKRCMLTPQNANYTQQWVLSWRWCSFLHLIRRTWINLTVR